MDILDKPPKKVIPPLVLAGFGVPVIFTTIWIIAAALDGQWFFGWNALSDLGACKNEASRILFNYGCVLTGVSGMMFGYGVFKHEKSWLAMTGLVTAIGTVFLMGVGAIPETYGEPHLFCAGAFGFLAVVAMATSAVGDWRKDRKVYSYIALILLAICAIVTIPNQFGIFEAVSIICILVWVGSQAYKYYKMIGLIEIRDPLKEIFEEDEDRIRRKLHKTEKE